MSLLSARQISFSYTDAPTLSGVTLEVSPGSRRALIGPNGSGKTTLLRVLSGILSPSEGSIEWEGIDTRRYSRRELARRIALVPQELNVEFGLTVREMVMLGRTPHLHALGSPTRHDAQVVENMMGLTEIGGLGDRFVSELSGGEKQRVVIAMALAQEPQLLLLDEPTVHLDINHQVEILDLLVRLNRERGLTVLATMHDLNLAALYFDQLVLLKQGRILAAGAPAEVLSTEQIGRAFEARVQIQPHPTHPAIPQVMLLPKL